MRRWYERMKTSVVFFGMLAVCFCWTVWAEELATDSGQKWIKQTFRRGISTVDVLQRADGSLVRASVTVKVYDIRGKMVWMELYIYEPLPDKTIAVAQVKKIVGQLLENPILKDASFQFQLQLVRQEILWDSDLPGGNSLPALPQPGERSPDGI